MSDLPTVTDISGWQKADGPVEWGCPICGVVSVSYTQQRDRLDDPDADLMRGILPEPKFSKWRFTYETCGHVVELDPPDPWDACLDVDPFTGQPDHEHGDSCEGCE